MDDEVIKLLTVIRDQQREQIELNQKSNEQSLELQKLSVARQARLLRIYVCVVVVAVAALFYIFIFGITLRR